MAVTAITRSLFVVLFCVYLTGGHPVETSSWPFRHHNLLRHKREVEIENTTMESSGTGDNDCYHTRGECLQTFDSSEFVQMTTAAFDDGQPFITNNRTLETLCSVVDSIVQCIDDVGLCGDSSDGSSTENMEYMCTPHGRAGYLSLNGVTCTGDPFRSAQQCVEENNPMTEEYIHCNFYRAWRDCTVAAAITHCGIVLADFLEDMMDYRIAAECLED